MSTKRCKTETQNDYNYTQKDRSISEMFFQFVGLAPVKRARVSGLRLSHNCQSFLSTMVQTYFFVVFTLLLLQYLTATVTSDSSN